jgi:sugar phosphate isomerase/epimerase
MYLTGFADEAAVDIDGQIAATKELGWSNIESRNIDGINIHDLSDEKFDEVAAKLDAAGIHINCFGSAIANWGKQLTDEHDPSFDELERAVPRMQRLGTKLIRIMSYAVLPDREAGDQMREERFERVRKIVARLNDAGITPVHENCMNYGGMGWSYTLDLLENVPGLKLVFDTGNPVFADDCTKPKPYPKQSAWEFYQHVKEHVAYIHIKDCVWKPEAEKKQVFTFPGEGGGDVERIVKDLLDNGYDGGISIEPHMALVFHDADDDPSKKADFMRENYVEYGRRMMDLIRKVGHGDKL